MREIKCSECGKHLFETDKLSDRDAGYEAMKLGFIFKIPVFYGIYGHFFFCGNKCHEEWCKKNITKESKEKVDEFIKELESEQQQMIEDLSKGAKRIVNVFNK